MYVKDIDANQTLEHILTYSLGDKWYPVATKDELGKQLPSVNKKFTDYKSFAGKTIDEIFTTEQLKDADLLEVNTFESVYLENAGNKSFKLHKLPLEAQISKIFAFHIEDVDQDGNLDVLLGGNFYGVSMYQGRYDASYGLLLKGNGKGNFAPVLPTENGFLLEGEVRDIKSLQTKDGKLLLVARNNLPLQVFKPIQKSVLPAKSLTLHQ
jgi:enediyne biosynthesis protein E4